MLVVQLSLSLPHIQGCHLFGFLPEASGFEVNLRAPVLLEKSPGYKKKWDG